MSYRKSILMASMLVGILSACGDKKAKNDGHSHAADNVPEMSKDAPDTDAKMESAKKMESDSLRKIDSLRQVEEHGHAH